MALHLLGFLHPSASASRPPFPTPHSTRNPIPLQCPLLPITRGTSPSLPFHVFPSGAHQWFFSASPLSCVSSPVATVEEKQQSPQGNRTRLIAQNIPWTCTADDIRRLFDKHGSVDDVELSMYNSTRNRGLAFVTMQSEEEAMEAINSLNMQELDGRTIRVEFARSLKKKPSVKPEPVKKYNVFVGNLTWGARSRDLRELFSAFNPNILSVEVIFRSNPRRTAGYGFASFATREEAEAAITALDGKSHKKMWPPWLCPLLHAEFFIPCEFHGGSSRNECNMYCLDCSNGGLCSSCLVDHRDHRVIQIRRSSYHDVIRVAEIQKHLDISGVQTYVINGARIVFLNERPQPRPGKTATNCCSHCKRSLLDALSFCSLGCKVVKTTSEIGNDDLGMAPSHSKLEKGEPKAVSHWQSFKTKAEFRYQGGRVSPPEPAIDGSRATKRRKGVPHRAPMGAC